MCLHQLYNRRTSTERDGLVSVTLENIKNHFRKVRHYMFGYMLGVAAGPELEQHVKKCKKIYTSHRRVGVDE